MKKILQVHWKENVIVLFFTLGSGISTIMGSLITADILNALIDFEWESFRNSLLLLIISQATLLFFLYFQIKYINITIQKMANYLRFQVIDQIARLSPTEFKKKTIGSYTSWLTNDINQIEQVAFEKIYELLIAVVTLLLSIFTLLFIHWSIFLMVGLVSLIILQLPQLMGKKLNRATIAITNQNEQSTSKTTYLLSGYETFYHLKNLFYFVEKIKNEFFELAILKNKQAKIIAYVAILGSIGNVIGQISAFSLAGYLALSGLISIGMIITVSNLSGKIFNVFGNLSQNIAIVKSAEPIIEKIENFLKAETPEVMGQVTISQLSEGIQLKNLTYSYNKSDSLFKDINYEFLLNHKYAIIGKSGSGKSTVLNILSGTVVDYEGHVYLGGIDLATLDRNNILDFIIYIEQKPYILKGSIRENILLGETYSDQEVEAVLESVGMSQFNGHLDYLLEEQGNNISGGQKQRLALARGLIRKKPIILLDESTSSLDKKTAFEIERFILSMEEVTVIMVTHHLTTVIKEKVTGILNLS